MWQDAQAYVDPGTGTILIQWLFGAVMAGLAVLSVYWQRAKGFVARKFGGNPPVEESKSEPKEAGSD